MSGRHRDSGGLSQWLYRVSTGWVVLGAIAVFVVFSATVLPMAASDAEEYANGAASPDTSFWYSAADLRQAADAFGPEGREAYVQARFTFDLVWPLVYGAFLATTLSWLLARGLVPGSPWRRLNLLPIAVVAFDYAENVCTALTIGRYPAETAVLPYLAPLFTASKWALITASFLLIPIAGGLALRRRGGRAGRGPEHLD